ncbi:MAG: peptidyl-prolyl cis-trans isomerase [Deltaproteobacteria bacterium]|nr:peptidyl-prolyl cis-trans isomerase [Deltaproteobacteria bacterium]
MAHAKRWCRVTALGLMLLVAGCSGRDGASDQQDKAAGSKSRQAIAVVGGKEISREEIKRSLGGGYLRRRGIVSPRAARARLDEMLTSRALYHEGLRIGIGEEPEIRRRIRRIIVQRLLEEKVEKPVRDRGIKEEDLRAYYEAHIREFSRPEQVRLADIFIAVPPDAGPEQREAKRRLAQKVLQEALDTREKRFAFSRLIREYSSRPKGYRKGDTGFFDREGNPRQLPRALVEAGFQLKRNGEIARGIVETPGGFHVIMRVAKRDAVRREFRDIAPTLERRMMREELEKRRAEFIRAVKEKARIHVNEQALAELIKEMNASSKTDAERGARGGGPPRLPRSAGSSR